LEKRSIYGELDCFLGVENGDDLGKDVLADETAGDGFALFWEAVAEPEMEAFPCFQE